MSEQPKELQLDYKGTISTRKKLVGRCYKRAGPGKTLSRSYYENIEFWGFTSSEAESFDEGKIRKLFAEEIRTDKLEPASKGRFGPSLAIEDFLEDASFIPEAQDPPRKSPFGLWSDLGADISKIELSPEPEVQTAPHTPESVLAGLRDSSVTGALRRDLVIQAEFLRFSDEQNPDLLSVLWDFINASRDSREFDDLIAVGSAIRKYVANMETANIGSIATLLEAGHAGTPPLDVELEIVKMIYRSFEANPPTKPDPEPELAERVYEIATEYLRPRVFPHGKHATVAMLAVLALAAMLSKRASEALATVNMLPPAHHWFREQLRRRLINLRERWAGDPEAARNLSKLMASVVEQ